MRNEHKLLWAVFPLQLLYAGCCSDKSTEMMPVVGVITRIEECNVAYRCKVTVSLCDGKYTHQYWEDISAVNGHKVGQRVGVSVLRYVADEPCEKYNQYTDAVRGYEWECSRP